MVDESFVLEARMLARFLALLCYKQLGLPRDAEDALVQLYGGAASSKKSTNYIMLGYGCLELGLMDEAVEAFYKAARLRKDKMANEFWLSIILSTFMKIQRIMEELYGLIASSEQFIASNHAREERIRARRKRARRSRPKLPDDSNSITQPSYTERVAEMKVERENKLARVASGTSHSSLGVLTEVDRNCQNASGYSDDVFEGPATQPNYEIQSHYSTQLSGELRPKHRSNVYNPMDLRGVSSEYGSRQQEQSSNINDRLVRIGDTLKSRYGSSLSQNRVPYTAPRSYLSGQQ
jgi:tetratricopeptide (TPR) repeat protein